MALEFIADADALSSPAERDFNGNGIIEANEDASYPGELYDIREVPALQGEAFLRPTVDEQVAIDQWGSTISGYAPIKNGSGNTVAIFAVDIAASILDQRGKETFVPLSLFLILFACFVFVRILAWGQFMISKTRPLGR